MENNGCCMTKPDDKSCSTEKPVPGGQSGNCCGAIIKGAILGGIAMFIYISVSWMLLPWHKTTMMSFTDEHAVSAALTANAPQSGIYILPSMGKKAPESTAPAKAAKTPPVETKKPLAFVSVFNGGIDMKGMKGALIKEFLLCLFSAMLLTGILKKTSCCPVLLSFKAGVLVAVINYVPDMIWFHFPLKYSLVGMADDVLALTFAGMIISKCALKSGPCTMGKAKDCK